MDTSQNYEPIEILLVEDNPGDIRLIKEVLKEGKVLNNLILAKDGVEAMEILENRDIPKPALILLDLNLPRKNGLEVLAEVKNNPELRKIPVIVLTTSSAEEDIVRSYDLFANAYLTKPVELEEFIRLVRTIEGFWLTVVKYPLRTLP